MKQLKLFEIIILLYTRTIEIKNDQWYKVVKINWLIHEHLNITFLFYTKYHGYSVANGVIK